MSLRNITWKSSTRTWRSIRWLQLLLLLALGAAWWLQGPTLSHVVRAAAPLAGVESLRLQDAHFSLWSLTGSSIAGRVGEISFECRECKVAWPKWQRLSLDAQELQLRAHTKAKEASGRGKPSAPRFSSFTPLLYFSHLSVSRLEVNGVNHSAFPLTFSVKAQQNRATLSAGGQVSSAHGLTGDFRGTLDEKALYVELQLDRVSLSEKKPLSSYLAPVSLPLKATAGTVEIEARGEWSASAEVPRLSAEAQVLNARVEVAGVELKGGEGRFAYSSATNAITSLGLVRGSLVDSPLPLSVPRANLRVELPTEGRPTRIEWSDAAARLFGGEVSLVDSAWVISESEPRFVAIGKTLSLREIVEFFGGSKTLARGLIDLRLPVSVAESGITIREGSIEGRGRGRLELTESSLTKSLPPQARAALQEFAYSDLSGEVEYSPDGVLTTDLKIKGVSGEGRKVNLNLTLENNVQKLLRSYELISNPERFRNSHDRR